MERRRTIVNEMLQSGYGVKNCMKNTRNSLFYWSRTLCMPMLHTSDKSPEAGWRYILNVKPDSHKSLFKQFEGRRKRGDVKELRETDRDGVEHYFAWTNGLWLCESATDVKVNFLLYEERKPNGETRRWTWITNLPLTKITVQKVMRIRTLTLED
jgi:hypothetical protein